jgi:class 3 adenylate cyclase
VARKREFKIRNIFQLYVPKEVIDEVFVKPESMLVGSNKEAAILFSDIRGFTTISEKLAPDDLVDSLNRYFDAMVGVIVDRGGTVDKYIGDAIMAVFGAPVPHSDDALRSVLAGLEMTKRLEEFNADQLAKGKDPFRIGVGISYGVVTAGNIGCDLKMNYTVIGDEVNLASRIEGQTKRYKQPILISGAIYQRVKNELPCRLVDYVAVKGKKVGVRIYTARSEVAGREAEAWTLHEKALERYFSRDFRGASELLLKVLELLPGDVPAELFLERCRAYSSAPPPPDWDGVEVLTEK